VSPFARGFAALLSLLARGFASLPRPVAIAATLAWMATIFWLSSARRDFLPPGPLGAFTSNAAHGPIFGLLALLAARATGSVPLGLAISVLYGLGDEWHQSFVPGRSSSPFDLATDTVGSLAALGLMAVPLAESVALRRAIASAIALAMSAGLATALG
jgi:hypothetical protein